MKSLNWNGYLILWWVIKKKVVVLRTWKRV